MKNIMSYPILASIKMSSEMPNYQQALSGCSRELDTLIKEIRKKYLLCRTIKTSVIF